MTGAPGWPVQLQEERVGLRPIRRSDAGTWRALRLRNSSWLQRWEATPPDPRSPAVSFGATVRYLRTEARAGRAMPFVVTWDGVLVGQVTVSGITRGSLCSAQIGYWVDEGHAGRGIIPTAVALAVDHCFVAGGMHRIEINIRPENTASLRVVEKLGFTDEGLRRRLLHIDGDWRDHRSFALLAEDVPGGLLERWRRVRSVGR
ncbi:ribosomal-protein-alanine N-acetyltransferase [Motilibacter rhizosphaerae]|uniref:Ribosomal-protein-alanine N-acetyltransferase n=1 Tax=Motilibacter rhizosphaerae TaxID=598652 RepID=A0A4V2F4F8_9ACTN|nr:GNAT family protein [Motilibacter rhizosphaerae]RZS87457.1 ribosomal-protein-alanine N-acetyltransferase [Motilibacter rhizosphaerae]